LNRYEIQQQVESMRQLNYDEETIRSVIKSNFGEDAVHLIDKVDPTEKDRPEEPEPILPPEEEAQIPGSDRKRKLSAGESFLGCGTFFAVVIIIFTTCSYFTGNGEDTAALMKEAYRLSHSLVAESLPSGDSIEFPDHENPMVNKRDDKYIVTSYATTVDSEGQKERLYYIVEIEYTEEKEWHPISVELMD